MKTRQQKQRKGGACCAASAVRVSGSDALVPENFFHLSDFALCRPRDLFAHSFAFHIRIVRRAAGDFFGFAFGLPTRAFGSVSDAAFHNLLLLQQLSAEPRQALPETNDLGCAISRRRISFGISGRNLNAPSGRAAIVRRRARVFLAACKGAFVDFWGPAGWFIHSQSPLKPHQERPLAQQRAAPPQRAQPRRLRRVAELRAPRSEAKVCQPYPAKVFQ
jgi:hypothetical protein